MERMLVVVFNDESKAYQGSRALKELDTEGSIAIHAEVVIKKNLDDTVTIKEEEEEFPIGTAGGTAIGALIGLLEGPVGLGVGALAGAAAGSIGDLYSTGVSAEFVDEVAATLTPGKCAVIADVSEEWVTPVDTRMEPLGGIVLRKSKRMVEDEERARDIAALQAEMDQLEVELARASGERKIKLQAKIDQLNAELQSKLDQARQRVEQIKSATEAKVQALQRKAEKAQGEMKNTLEARVKGIRAECEEAETKLKHVLAAQLKEAAARLDK